MRRKGMESDKRAVYRKGYRRNIMRLILTCGCLSRRSIHMLGEDNFKVYLQKLKKMEEEGVIEEIRVLSKNEGYHKTMRLANIKPATEKYLEYFPSYIGHYYRYGLNNAKYIALTKQKGAAIKAYRESEVVSMLAPTSVRVFPDEKVAIREEKGVPLYPPSFYNSMEIREGTEIKIRTEGKDKADIINSRAIGLIISEGGYYGVYHTEDKQIRWVKSIEGQITSSMARLINKKCKGITEEERNSIRERSDIKNREQWKDVELEKISKVKEGILIGKNDEIFVKTYKNTSAGKLNLYESGYEKLYALPYTRDGQKMIEVMTRKDWQEELKQIYLNGMDLNTRMSSVPCDGIDGDKYVLLFCIPDLIKLRKFINVATYANEPEKYQIYCFDFQEDFINEVVGRFCEVNYAEFKTYCEYKGIEDAVL